MAVSAAPQARDKVARGKCERSEARRPWIFFEQNIEHCKCHRKLLLLNSVALSELNPVNVEHQELRDSRARHLATSFRAFSAKAQRVK
jgi:hypothetical protein